MPQQLIKRAMILHRQQNLPAAIELYQQALNSDPTIVQAWTNLGVALRKLKQYQSSLNCQLRALALVPNDSLVLNNLGNLYKDLNLLDQSIRCGEQACELEPGNVGYWFNLAVNLREAKQYERALKVLEKCIVMDATSKPKYEWEMALCYLYLENHTDGWRTYRARLATGVLPARTFNCPEWMGESLANKTIWVVTEQGFGDTIFASRYLTPLVEMGAQIIFECKPPLERLLSSLPLKLIPPAIDRPVGKGADYYVYIMDLPGIFERMGWSTPSPVSLKIPEQEIRRFKRLILTSRNVLNVGIVWSGSETFGDNARRSPGLKPFLNLASVTGLRLFSLQKGLGEKELDQHFARAYITDLAPHIKDFADTAAAINALDLVVMSDSAVAHLTASLGKPVWNLLHSNPYWMYGLSSDSTQWYSSMRFFRQQKAGDWESVFSSVQEHLKQLCLSRNKID